MSAESGEREWKWTGQRETAAALVAADEIPDREIAARVGVVERTLERWKLAPEFRQRVDAHIRAFKDRVRRRGIAILEKRVAALDDRWNRLQEVIAQRAAAAVQQASRNQAEAVKKDAELAGAPLEDFAEYPGILTGLIVRDVKAIKSYPAEGGKPPQTVFLDEYGVDTGILGELRAHEVQAAKELQQWLDKTDVTSAGKAIGAALLEDLSDDELDRRLADAEARKAPKTVPS